MTSEQSGWVSHSSRRSSRDASSGQLSPDTDREAAQVSTIRRADRGAAGRGAVAASAGGAARGEAVAPGPHGGEVSGELLRARLKELAQVSRVQHRGSLPLPDVAPDPGRAVGRAVPDLVAGPAEPSLPFPFPDLVSSSSPLLPPVWFANPPQEEPGRLSPPSPAPGPTRAAAGPAPIAVAEPAFDDEELQLPPPSMFSDAPPPPEPFRDDAPATPSVADLLSSSRAAVLADLSPSEAEAASPLHVNGGTGSVDVAGDTPPRSQSQRVSPSMGVRAKLTASVSASTASLSLGRNGAHRMSPRPAVRQTASSASSLASASSERPVPAKRNKFPPPLSLPDEGGVDKRPWRRPIPITSGVDPPAPGSPAPSSTPSSKQHKSR